MTWKFGIPDVSLGQNFVYFLDLINTENNSQSVAMWKQKVYAEAKDNFNFSINAVSAESSINNAVTFLKNVTDNERKKEIAAARAYCKKMKDKFPFLDDITEENALNDPEDFYLKLTSAINQGRLTTQQYINELNRIKNNIEKQKLSDYFADDYRYRLSGDISSFLKKLIGTYQEREKNETAYSNKIHNIVLEIIQQSELNKKLTNGEDYAAIGAAILTDIEKNIQKKFDEERKKDNSLVDFTQLEDSILEEVKNEYINQLKNEKEQSPIQRAINDINGEEFIRITNNVKKYLQITTLDKDSKEYQSQLKKINNQKKRRTNDTRESRKIVSNVQKKIKKYKGTPLNQITFKLSLNNQVHGTIQEMIQSILSDGGVGGGKGATDLFSILCNYNIQPNREVNNILEELIKITDLNTNYEKEDKANEKDLRDSIKIMNEKILSSIDKLEEQLKEIEHASDEEFFIFHESLKLYSSIETGVYKKWNGHAGFSGRYMNILSALDFVYSMMESAGITTPATRDELAFIALNLSTEAVGQGNKNPLERYFSLFAGMLMFDDMINMAKEATNQLENSNIKQVHLYNLNGIYVPASMIMGYAYDAITEACKVVDNGYAAKATIESQNADKIISNWLDNRKNGARYSAGEWNRVGSAVASATKVKISFMAAFLVFIDKLSNIG